jgi:hypothetical protein
MIENPLEGDKDWLKPADRSDYARVRLFMATARENEVINVMGDGIDKLFYDGSHNGCIIRLDHRHAAPIYIDEIKRIKRKFSRIYLTNTAAAGKELILGITKSRTCDIVPEDETSFRSDADGFVTGRNQVGIIGGFYNETGIAVLTNEEIGACKITDERELHVRAMPPQMETFENLLTTDAQQVTTATPGAHYAYEVLGYQITEHIQGNATITVAANIKFPAGARFIWKGASEAETADLNLVHTMTNIRIRGAENEGIQLNNSNVNAAAGQINVLIYYQKVRIN